MTGDQFPIASIREHATLKPDMTGAEIGIAMTARMTKAELRAFAAAYVESWVDSIRRAAVRQIEERAERPILEPGNPGWMPRRPDQPWYVGNCGDRTKFRRSMTPEAFDEWYRRMRVQAEAAGPIQLEIFEEDWHPDGVHARRRERMAGRITSLVATMAAEIRLETTRELLESVFALGDGVEVTWGDATVEQHRQRIALLVGNATGNVEAAVRHEAAIQMIAAADARCLREVAPQVPLGRAA